MSDQSDSEGNGVAAGLGTAFIATKLIDVCFYGGLLAGGPVGAALGLGVAVGLMGLGIGAAVKSGSKQ